jgi:hypothetical protein
VIAELNQNFVPVELNLTSTKFPKSAPGLAKWALIYGLIPTLKNGFVWTVVLDPTGKLPIADSGSSNITEVSTAINYNPDKYLAFLKDSLVKFRDANWVKK